MTFYPSEINQTLGFDTESGEITTVKKADRASDKKLLAAFASHHKVTFPMQMLTKKAALEAYDAYVVNGGQMLQRWTNDCFLVFAWQGSKEESFSGY